MGKSRTEACERLYQLTGLRRGPTQVRKFLKDLGLKWQRVRADPRAAQKNLAEHVATQAAFLDTELKPRLDAAGAGRGHVFFVDAAHFVFGTFLCCLWSFVRMFVRAASGRQRFNVLGAWDAVTQRVFRRDQHDGGEHRDDVRATAEDRRGGADRADHAGAGQRPLSAERRGSGVGGAVGDHSVVSAVVLAEPEPDRAAVEVPQAAALYGDTTRSSPTSKPPSNRPSTAFRRGIVPNRRIPT